MTTSNSYTSRSVRELHARTRQDEDVPPLAVRDRFWPLVPMLPIAASSLVG